MIKLSANVSKKLPVPDRQYSSRSYSAGIEVEVTSGASGEELKEKLAAIYALLEEAVDEQLESRESAAQPTEPQQGPQSQAGIAGKDSGRKATDRQVNAIETIAKERGYAPGRLTDLIAEKFGVGSPVELSAPQASRLIDLLKTNGKE